jgi:hypothetical protein
MVRAYNERSRVLAGLGRLRDAIRDFDVAIRLDPYVNYLHTVEFVPGMLLIWPSYVSYFLHPHLAASPAVHVGFDVQVKPAREHNS